MKYLWLLIFFIVSFQTRGKESLMDLDTSVLSEDNQAYVDSNLIEENWGEDAYDQEDESILTPAEIYPSQPVTIDADQWNKITDDPAFNYEQDTQQSNNQSAIAKFFESLINFLVTSGKWIIWLLVITIVLFVVYFLLKRLTLLPKQNKSKEILHEQVQQHFNFEEAINKAIQQKDFPLAVSLVYQHTIVLLKQKGELDINNETPNAQILQQVRKKDYYKILKQQFNTFEMVHFGEYPIAPTQFDDYYQQYLRIKSTVAA